MKGKVTNMEKVCDNFGVLYMSYDKYAKNCEANGKTPVGFMRYLYSTLTGKEL